MQALTDTTYTEKAGKRKNCFYRLGKDMKKNPILYLMILPVVAYYIIFHYVPMYGIQIAFKDFVPKLGFLGSPWVGLDHFTRFFSGYNFKNLLRNTLEISVYGLLVGFPIPILFALLLNYLPGKWFQKSVQMVSYAPNFISTVVMCGMITIFLAPDTGIINQLVKALGGKPVAFLSVPEFFKSIYVWTGVWQGMGFSSIIYISALSGVDYQIHEAAIIDGATKLQRILNIDIPSIAPTMIILLILSLGSIMGVGFEKIYLLQNPLNMSASDVISTYVYRVGLIDSDYSYSTAIGLFNSVINAFLLIIVNSVAKRFTSTSLW
ncbi:ABC transporter permease subunit [Eubacteriales bacterium mix99]